MDWGLPETWESYCLDKGSQYVILNNNRTKPLMRRKD